jgi:methylmalonyl-CoA/ethylmalonyl-CoA epimerase
MRQVGRPVPDRRTVTAGHTPPCLGIAANTSNASRFVVLVLKNAVVMCLRFKCTRLVNRILKERRRRLEADRNGTSMVGMALRVTRLPEARLFFAEHPESVDVSIRFLKIAFGRSADLFLELFTFHSPAGRQEITLKKTNDMGGPRHVCLRVTNIDEVFAHVKSLSGVRLINDSPDYRPCLISPIEPREIELPHEDSDMAAAKEAICKIVKEIRYFYAIDRYGIQWEFEEGHADIGTA